MDKVAYTKSILIKCAQDRSVIVGSDLAKKIESEDDVNNILDEVAKECIENDEPNLTALVIQAKTGIPSRRFFTVYNPEVLGFDRKTRTRKWLQLRDSVYDHYTN